MPIAEVVHGADQWDEHKQSHCTAVVVLVAAGVRRMLRLPPPSRKLARFRRVVLSVASVGALYIAYGYFVEPYWR
jgi:hypothetical protein